MLTGKELGSAIASAIEKMGVSKVAVAREFGVKPPSIQDWINRGTIGKEKLPLLWVYFADVVGPEHWGLSAFPGQPAAPVRRRFDELTEDEIALLDDFRAMMDDDQADLANEIAKRAEKIRSHMRKVTEKQGLPNMVSANARRPKVAATSVDPSGRLRQQQLPLGPK